MCCTTGRGSKGCFARVVGETTAVSAGVAAAGVTVVRLERGCADGGCGLQRMAPSTLCASDVAHIVRYCSGVVYLVHGRCRSCSSTTGGSRTQRMPWKLGSDMLTYCLLGAAMHIGRA